MSDKPEIERVDVGDGRPVHGSWYRGKVCHTNPYKEDLLEPGAVEEYYLKGWLPTEPWLTENMLVTTFGSCFAIHISKYLEQAGFLTLKKQFHPDSHIIRYGDGIVNTHSLVQQFLWAWEGKNPREETWHGWAGDVAESGEEARLETKKVFDQTDVFILTLGLNEVWCNKKTNEVFWRAIPKSVFDPEVHGFRVLGFKENLENLETVWDLIKFYRPNARVIVTLSPVSLVATFRPINCISANEASKACLRAAIDQFMLDNWERVNLDLFYWPSYELVRNCPWAGDPYEKDNRHVRKHVIDSIMDLFIKHHCFQE